MTLCEMSLTKRYSFDLSFFDELFRDKTLMDFFRLFRDKLLNHFCDDFFETNGRGLRLFHLLPTSSSEMDSRAY